MAKAGSFYVSEKVTIFMFDKLIKFYGGYCILFEHNTNGVSLI